MENLDRTMTGFPVTIYGNLSNYNDVTSRGRCRIFYKGGNRNGTYITDEFAESLLATIPYTPVKGIYEGEDFTDHGDSRSLGRIYGIVPENPNLQWEIHTDEDGVEREYACVDVLLFTALYKEAGEIIGKSQSMELYDKSIDGAWQFINGKRYFVFSKACFLGLQALGEDVEPCFEGASFFTKCDTFDDLIKRIDEYNASLTKYDEGGNKMPSIDYKISDDQKYNMLWDLLNPNYNEEGSYTVNYDIVYVYDEYAVCRKRCNHSFERVYYSKDDETDSLSLGRTEVCYIVDVTESEKAALEALHKLNQGTYDKVDEVYASLETLKQEKEELGSKIEECTASIATLTTERDEAVSKFTEASDLLTEAKTSLEEAQVSLSTLQTERDALAAYKDEVETNKKLSVIDSYTKLLSDEILNSYKEKVSEYTEEQLDMTLAYELKKANPSVFTTKEVTPTFIPKDETPLTGIEAILSKYQK